MIEAKYLRVGNWLKTQSEEPEIIVIDAIDSIEETISGNGLENIPFKELEYIPITREYLLTKSSYNTLCNGTNEYTLDSHKFELFIHELNGFFISLNDVDPLMEVSHVHELQNFYFAINNKDL